MSDSEDELEEIRQRKREKLKEQHEADGEQTGTGQTSSPGEPIQIDGEADLQEVLEEHRVVLVDCYADWCGPCQMMEPTIEALAAETDAAVAKVDVDSNQRLAHQLGAQGVPTLLVYSDGEPVERLVGAQDRGTLEGLLEQAS